MDEVGHNSSGSSTDSQLTEHQNTLRLLTMILCTHYVVYIYDDKRSSCIIMHTVFTRLTPHVLTDKLDNLAEVRPQVRLWCVLHIDVKLLCGLGEGRGKLPLVTQPNVGVYLEVMVQRGVVGVSVVSEIKE